ncbi:MAG: hypothetical protein KTR25_20195 [Myxococcales bacterium]|nr:hypothetical protein [Myxococcales bacterium]
MIVSSPERSSATGVTLASFYVVAIGLSLLPVPSWLQPTELLSEDDPIQAIAEVLLSKPESIPLPDQQVDQQQAEGDLFPNDNEDPSAVLAVGENAGVHTRTLGRTETPWVMPPRPQLDRYAELLGLMASPLERPCLRPRRSRRRERSPVTGKSCERLSMSRFFERLRKIESGTHENLVARVVHFGDSLIASDKISDMVRKRLQERFGSGGKGFLMAKRLNQLQKGQRSGRGSDGWELDIMTAPIHRLDDRHFGFSGASFTAKKRREMLLFEPIGASRFVDIFYLSQPKGGRLTLLADDVAVGRLNTKSANVQAQVEHFVLPETTKKLELRSESANVRLYGMSLEAKRAGIVWTTLGLPGATSDVWLRPNKEEFVRLLSRHRPHLAVFMLGGNDGLMLSKKKTTLRAIEKSTRRLVGRVREAYPRMDCLLVSPLEAVRAKGGGRRLIPKPEVPKVIEIQRRVARKEGCAFWDMYTSMGGKGSLKKWVKARLMLADFIHPKSRGSNLLGEIMAEAIMTAYDEHITRDDAQTATGG